MQNCIWCVLVALLIYLVGIKIRPPASIENNNDQNVKSILSQSVKIEGSPESYVIVDDELLSDKQGSIPDFNLAFRALINHHKYEVELREAVLIPIYMVLCIFNDFHFEFYSEIELSKI